MKRARQTQNFTSADDDFKTCWWHETQDDFYILRRFAKYLHS
jgi:hypothetical protein